MKTRPVNKMMLLALGVVVCVLLAVGAWDEANAEVVTMDARLASAMDESGLEYEVEEDKDVKVLLKWDDNRSHRVWANTVTETYEQNIEIREVWGVVAEYDSTEDVPKEVLMDLMTGNFQQKFGKYALFVGEESGKVTVLFVLGVAPDLDGATLAKVINFVGTVADEKEKEVEDPRDPDRF